MLLYVRTTAVRRDVGTMFDNSLYGRFFKLLVFEVLQKLHIVQFIYDKHSSSMQSPNSFLNFTIIALNRTEFLFSKIVLHNT